MFGQMTAGSWIYIGTQGILQGTYQTFAAAGEKHFGSRRPRGPDDPHGRARRDGRGPAARRDDGRRRDPLHRGRSGRGSSAGSRPATWTRRPSRSTTRSRGCGQAARERRPLSVGSARQRGGRRSELARRGEHFDLVTDQTAAHDPLNGYVPAGLDVEEAAELRERDPDEYLRRARESIARMCDGLLEYVRAGSYVFDYGNNLRGEAREAGVEDAFTYPGFVPAYIRPLFCRGHRAVPLGGALGRASDIAAIDATLRELFPDDALLQRWLELAPERVAFQGLPARICWLGLGDRAQGGACDQRARSRGRGDGAGRDRTRPPRLGLGRVAVPRDGGDARRLRRDRRLADPERARSTRPRARPG